MTEDLVIGHFGVGTSFDRYAYAWDKPLNFDDLDADRFVQAADSIYRTVGDQLTAAGGDEV